eukprot:6176808-Pleurochrysis_carterae.AAC.1
MERSVSLRTRRCARTRVLAWHALMVLACEHASELRVGLRACLRTRACERATEAEWRCTSALSKDKTLGGRWAGGQPGRAGEWAIGCVWACGKPSPLTFRSRSIRRSQSSFPPGAAAAEIRLWVSLRDQPRAHAHASLSCARESDSSPRSAFKFKFRRHGTSAFTFEVEQHELCVS